jgi:hypothetical protein
LSNVGAGFNDFLSCSGGVATEHPADVPFLTDLHIPRGRHNRPPNFQFQFPPCPFDGPLEHVWLAICLAFVGADPSLTTWGCGVILGLVSVDSANTFATHDGAEGAQRYLDPFFVVPGEVLVHRSNEHFDGGRLPVPQVEHLIFRRPKKPSQAALSGENPLRDIDGVRFVPCIRSSQPGQREWAPWSE